MESFAELGAKQAHQMASNSSVLPQDACRTTSRDTFSFVMPQVRTHLVAENFSPFRVAQLPCSLSGSTVPLGSRL